MHKMFKNKRGVYDQLSSAVIGLVAIGIVLAVGFLILAQIKSNPAVSADGNASAAIGQVVSATAQIPAFLPIIVIVTVGAILISLIFVFRGQ